MLSISSFSLMSCSTKTYCTPASRIAVTVNGVTYSGPINGSGGIDVADGVRLVFDRPLGKAGEGLFKTGGGTGKYRNVSDTGTATLVTIPGSSAESSMHGHFRLRFTTNPIAAE